MRGLDIVLTIFGGAVLWYAGSSIAVWLWEQTPWKRRERERQERDTYTPPKIDGSTYGL